MMSSSSSLVTFPNDLSNNHNNDTILPTALQSVFELVRNNNNDITTTSTPTSTSSSSTASSSTNEQHNDEQNLLDEVHINKNNNNNIELLLRIPYWCEENIWRLIQYKKQFLIKKEWNLKGSQYYVVIISNPVKNVAMFYQKAAAGGGNDRACCWDYHVILLQVVQQHSTTTTPTTTMNETPTKTTTTIQKSDNNVYVYDLDTTIEPYPISLTKYVQYTFLYTYPNLYAPMFRIIPAELYVEYFSSNRNHMYNVQKQQWNAIPPPYQCIMGNDATTTTTTTTNDNDTNSIVTTTDNTNRRSSNLHHYLNFTSPIDPNEIDCPIEAFGQIISLQQLVQLDFLSSS